MKNTRLEEIADELDHVAVAMFTIGSECMEQLQIDHGLFFFNLKDALRERACTIRRQLRLRGKEGR